MAEFIFAMIFVATLAFAAGTDYGNRAADKAIEACEKELPRNQRCVIIAVPEQDKAYD